MTGNPGLRRLGQRQRPAPDHLGYHRHKQYGHNHEVDRTDPPDPLFGDQAAEKEQSQRQKGSGVFKQGIGGGQHPHAGKKRAEENHPLHDRRERAKHPFHRTVEPAVFRAQL